MALQNLYGADDNVPCLNLFTERFYKRMLELADDSDISVSVCAIGLVKQLLRYSKCAKRISFALHHKPKIFFFLKLVLTLCFACVAGFNLYLMKS